MFEAWLTYLVLLESLTPILELNYFFNYLKMSWINKSISSCHVALRCVWLVYSSPLHLIGVKLYIAFDRCIAPSPVFRTLYNREVRRGATQCILSSLCWIELSIVESCFSHRLEHTRCVTCP